MVRFGVAMDNEQRLKDLERRRLRGARLLGNGTRAAEVARQTGVSRQTVMRWERALKENGLESLQRAEVFGRPRRLSAQQIQELGALLKAGSLAAGYATEIWTLPRIAQLIHRHFQLQLSQSSVWRTLRHMGWSVQRPARQARERDERAVQAWKKKRWPQLKK